MKQSTYFAVMRADEMGLDQSCGSRITMGGDKRTRLREPALILGGKYDNGVGISTRFRVLLKPTPATQDVSCRRRQASDYYSDRRMVGCVTSITRLRN